MMNAGSLSETPARSLFLSWAGLLAGSAIGIAVLLAAVGLQTRPADEIGLGINTISTYEEHPRGEFHFSKPEQLERLARDPQRFDGARRILWLGASQVFGVNAYRPGQHNVAYQVFDTLIDQGAAVVTFTLPVCFPQEHEVLLQHALGKMPLTGLIVGAVYPDMRHDTLRAGIARLVDDPDTRGRLASTAQGRGLIERASAAGASGSKDTVPGPQPGAESLMSASEKAVTSTLERWIGLETLRDAGRALVRIALEEARRALESLRARWTRDVSRYRVPIPPRAYEENLAAWREILATAQAQNIPALVYIAPRPTDFYPFDPDGYARFKQDIAGMARELGATFVNIEDAVANEEWGEVDFSFGFKVRDPYHFTARGHELMAGALLPHIRRTFRLGQP